MSSMEDRREKNESSSRISDMMLGAFALEWGNLFGHSKGPVESSPHNFKGFAFDLVLVDRSKS